jgi:NitT/TauT family transport system ATP-binding protein
MASAIRTEGVWKEFAVRGQAQPEVVLAGITFDIAEGEFVCLLGPSGCGKTTMLNLVAGFDLPTRGAVYVAGEAVRRPGPDKAVVFQDYALLPWLTVWRNVGLGPRIRGVSRAEADQTVARYLDLVRLTSFAQRFPHELSGGMRQRVSIARALALDPKVLLMDEPFAALDAQTRVMMQEELSRIWERTRKTVLFITHSLDESIFLADRILVMSVHPGQILETITVSLARPRDPTSPEFNAIKRHCSGLLKAESEKVMA